MVVPEKMIGRDVINLNLAKGFAFFKPYSGNENVFIPPHLVTDNNLKDGMSVWVEIEEYLNNRTGETKTRVKRIKG